MAKTKPRVLVTIDSNTIFRVLLILLGLLFLYYVREVLVIAFVAFILVSAITPPVDYLEKFKLPRTLVVLVIYVLTISVIYYCLYLLIPAIGDQLRMLGQNMPVYSQKLIFLQEKIQNFLGSHGGYLIQQERNTFLLNLGNRLNENWLGIFSQAGSFLGALIGTVAVFVLAFFLSIQEKIVGNFFKAFIPKHHQEYAVILVERIQQKMGYWLLGQITLNILMGLLIFIGMTIIGVPYALLLAVVAAVFEVIPYVGAFMSAALGITLAFSVSPLTALFALIIYVAVQQFQHNFMVPLVMRQVVGLNPVAVIIAILIGIKLAGPLGLLLAIPITAALSVFVSDFIAPEAKKS